MRVTEADYAKLKRGEKITPTEHAEQVEYFRWWHSYASAKGIPECLCFAIPNASALSDSGRIYKWAEGLVAGVSDIFLAVPIDRYHGLFIELKRHPNKLTLAQANFQTEAVKVGYATVLVYSAEDAIRAATGYLK